MRCFWLFWSAGLLLAEDAVLFDQTETRQWFDPSVALGQGQYKILAEDFELESPSVVTRIEVMGSYEATRTRGPVTVRLQIFQDQDSRPGDLMHDQSFSNPDADLDGDLSLDISDLSLAAGYYWLAIWEDASSGVSYPWAWDGADNIIFGSDYVVSAGDAAGPGSWTYSDLYYGENYPPGSLFFTILGSTQQSPYNAAIPPPEFITDRDIWVDEEGRIVVWCPDPNGDGAAPSGTVNRGYTFRLVQDCQVLESVTATPSVYPQVFKFSSPIPEGHYTIEVSRYFERAGKQSNEGVPRVYAGPSVAGSDTVISTNASEIPRWLLHIPRKVGGFEGSVTFVNRLPETPASVWVAGFDPAGNLIPDTRQKLLIVGVRHTLPLYSTDGAEGLFPESLQDQVSHVGLFEPMNAHVVDASLTYRAAAENAFPVTVDESVLSDGEAVGASFLVESRASTQFWDGAAILNLAWDQPIQVTAKLMSAEGTELASASLGSIPAGSKRLFVFSDFFPQSGSADTYYTVESQNDEPFQIIGLRGTLTSTPALLDNAKISKTQ